MSRKKRKNPESGLEKLSAELQAVLGELTAENALYWRYHEELLKAVRTHGATYKDVDEVAAARSVGRGFRPKAALGEASDATAKIYNTSQRTIERKIKAWPKKKQRLDEKARDLQTAIDKDPETQKYKEFEELMRPIPDENKLDILTALRRGEAHRVLLWTASSHAADAEELRRTVEEQATRLRELEAERRAQRDKDLAEAAKRMGTRSKR